VETAELAAVEAIYKVVVVPPDSNLDEMRLATSFGPFRRFNLAHLGTL